MDHAQSILSLTGPPIGSIGDPLAARLLENSIPYVILLLNYLLFQLIRSFVNKVFSYYLIDRKRTLKLDGGGKIRFLKSLINELISTCELCADCAELNVVFEKHGSFAYGLALFVLSYVWIDAFGDAYTTPGYLVEDYFLDKGTELFKTGETYARFLGQSLAMPLAWRFATLYWKYQLLTEHVSMLQTENCRTSLTTSSLNGFMIEFICCLICRLVELFGQKLQERRYLSQRAISVASSLICSLLVVLALELSGGYFNPILAASLEYGCKGIEWHQHAFVFWLGPLSGHVLARALFNRYNGDKPSKASQIKIKAAQTSIPHTSATSLKRSTRLSPGKKWNSDKID